MQVLRAEPLVLPDCPIPLCETLMHQPASLGVPAPQTDRRHDHAFIHQQTTWDSQETVLTADEGAEKLRLKRAFVQQADGLATAHPPVARV